MPKKPPKSVLPDHIPKGEVLTDITKKKWCLGPSIGVGGFGEIYSAAELDGSKKNLYEYVVKIEPHGNGPLFCEMHFFMRNAKPNMIKDWCSEKKISILGVPRYLGSGSHEYGGKKYRFLVMDKYGKDLWKIFLANNKVFPVHTVFRLGLQLLDSLEYIHSNGYCHADLKGANILLGLTKQTQNQVFLVDFGLASKYTQKEFKPDPKKAHNGTIEYTSRDAHDGVPTRRSDIEILGYNLVQWMGCVLPWEKNLKDPVFVQNSKIKYMNDITSFMKCCFGERKIPGALVEFLKYVAQMSYDTEPDYKKLRAILAKGLKAAGGSMSGPLEFKSSKHKNNESFDEETPEKKVKLTPGRRTPRSKINTPKKEESDSDKEFYTPDVKVSRVRGRGKSDDVETPEATKVRGRGKKVDVETPEATKVRRRGKSDDVETPEATKVRGRGRKVPKSSDNDESDNEVLQVNGHSRKESKEKSENPNGYNAEMLRIQKKIAERNATKSKRAKTYGSASSGSTINSPVDFLDDDVIDATPPEKINSVRRRVHTPLSKGDSDDITPRGRRQKR